MILVVGLGNVGPQYEQTRHNIGFRVVDQLASTEWQHQDRIQADIQKVKIAEQEVVLAKPTTMMNLSGFAVSRSAQYYKIAPSDIWIIYDELDLPLGRIKVSTGTSDNGHNGAISVHQQIGHNQLWRFRIGVDNREHREVPGRDYVLQSFTADESKLVDAVVHNAAQAVTLAISDGMVAAMQAYNKKVIQSA